MISFSESPEAFCEWLASQDDPNRVFKQLDDVLENGSWACAGDSYVRCFARSELWKGEARFRALKLRRRLIDEILAAPLNDGAHAALPVLFNTDHLAPLDETEKIVEWLTANAGPNDATMVAEIVAVALRPKRVELRNQCFPLVAWLLTKGSSELRSSRRAGMAVSLVTVVCAYGDEEQLAATIRYVLYNEERLSGQAGCRTVEGLLPAMERLLTARAHAEPIVGDLVEACEPQCVAAYVDRAIRRPHEFPLNRAEVVRRIALGKISIPDPAATWEKIVGGPDTELRFGNAELARDAVNGLARYSEGLLAGDNRGTADDERWSYRIVQQFLTISDAISNRDRDAVGRLRKCGGSDAILRGVQRALLENVEGGDDTTPADVREVLTSANTGPGVARAALTLLSAKPTRTASSRKRNTDHVVRAIENALHAEAPTVCGFNFRHATHRATRAAVTNLPGGRAFRCDGGALEIASSGIEGLLEVSTDPGVQCALGVLFVIHEVIHDFQGVAETRRVADVRFAGAEGALMHIDLGADHLAALVASSIFPKWELAWLKDWQGKSIEAFPAGPRNSPYSRVRKALRLVGLRVDFHLRKLAIGAEHLARQESYGFAEFSPSGGSFIVMVNRPPFVVLKIAEIDKGDAATLFEGVEGSPGAIDRVDRVINTALRGLEP